MKCHNQILQRVMHLLAVLFFTSSFVTSLSQAQQLAGAEPGVLRIKVSEEMARQLEGASMTLTKNNVMLTGITALDAVGKRYGAKNIKRVFRPAGKFEEKHRRYGLHRWYEIEIAGSVSVSEALAGYSGTDQVTMAEPVYKKMIIGSDSPSFGAVPVTPSVVRKKQATLPDAPNDPMFGGQWHYHNTGQTGGTPGADISLPDAWDVETGRSDVIVAVTDGGIQTDHPDLAANIWVNAGEIPGNGVDDDNNGYVDDIHGYSFGRDTGNITPDDHGTHVGGTIAATTDNGMGVAGIAGGSGAGDGVRLMSCVSFDNPLVSRHAETYIYAADMGAVISQNSWAYLIPGDFEQAVLDGIDYFIAEAGRDEFGNQTGPMSGGLVIFAAGNNLSNNQRYPAYYAPTLAVAATNHVDEKSWYSNFGEWVDIAAPGGETVSEEEEGVLSTLANNAYGFYQGTSMACPHVSGVAALIISYYGGPGFTGDDLRSRLVYTTDPIDHVNPDYAGLLGTGRLNAAKALQPDDGVPPDAVTDLAVVDTDFTSINLSWRAPAEATGRIVSYDIRYSATPINEDNFADAMPVSVSPVPGPIGETDFVTVTDLEIETEYYFALKSADMFGNVSAISNVVQQRTDLLPEITVSPSSLVSNLLTAETSTQRLTITNTGPGLLEFHFEAVDPSAFATPLLTSGTVLPGASREVEILFDANGLPEGTYTQELTVFSQDPVNEPVTVPVTMHVTNNGAPIASLLTESVDFGGVVVGDMRTGIVRLYSAGSDTLTITSVTSGAADFVPGFTGELQLAPFREEAITLSFRPSTYGAVSGVLSIHTNDPVNPVLTAEMTGHGLEGAGISVSPDALNETLFFNSTSTRLLNIRNVGVSGNLAFKIRTLQGENSTEQEWIRIPAAEPNVLIVSPDPDVTDLESILNSLDGIVAHIFPADSLPFITLADMAAYDIVMTTNNTPWLNAGIDPATVGDLLAGYIDQGGKVFVHNMAYSPDDRRMAGRFIDEQYGPFTPGAIMESPSLVSLNINFVPEPEHPIFKDFTVMLFTELYYMDLGLAPGATALGDWYPSNDVLCLAVNENVVGLNMVGSLGTGVGMSRLQDFAIFYENAIHWLSSPITLAPGESASMEVIFDASGLEQDTFTTTVDIQSNAYGRELISVPVTLTVTASDAGEAIAKGETQARSAPSENNLAEGAETIRIVSLYPVPARGELIVSVSGELKGAADVTVLNVQGQVLYHSRINAVQPGNLRLLLDEMGLNDGLYYLRMQGEGLLETRKFVKQ